MTWCYISKSSFKLVMSIADAESELYELGGYRSLILPV